MVKQMTMGKVLVTGGTGFLGKALATRLLAMGYDVSIFGRNEKIGAAMQSKGMHFFKGDLGNKQDVQLACEHQDYVIHSGALSSPWGAYQDFYTTNVLGTQNVIAGCMQAGVKRLVHVSTPSIYFDFVDRFDIKETDTLPKRFANHYATTKYLAEQEVDQAVRHGLEAITIRPRGLFGIEDTSIIPRLIRANEKGSVPLVNGGTNIIDVTYVENVVDALILCLNAPDSCVGRKYNITNGEPLPMRELLAKVFASLDMKMNTIRIPYKLLYHLAHGMEKLSVLQGGKEPIFTRYTVGVLSKSQTLDITAARKELGYTPRVRIDEGIAQFAEWWKKGGESRGD